MKKITYLLCILCMANACNNADDQKKTVNTKHFESALHHVSFDYPANWELSFIPDSTNPHAIIALKNPITSPEDNYAEELNIWWENLPVPVSDSMFHQSNITQIKIINDSIDVINDGLKIFNNNNFYEYDMNFTPDLGKNYYHVNGYSLVKDSIGFSINFTSEKNKSAEFQSDVETILTSFKPL